MTADPTPPSVDLSNEALDALEKDLRRKVTLGTGVVTPLRIQAADAITAMRTKYDILDGGYRALVSRCKKEVARAEKAEAERNAAMAGVVEPCGGCGETDPNRRCIGCLHPFTKPTSAAQPDPVTLTYRNWRGEISDRTIIPRRVWFGSTEWHPEAQWLLTAWDAGKDAERDFALADFLGKPGEREALIEALKQIYNMGQSAEPCHWNFRVQARKIAAEAVAAAENGNMKAGSEDRSSVLTALAVRDSKLRTKVMREALAIIAKIERDETADPDGILPPDRFDEGTSAAYEAIEDAIRAAEKEAGE